MKANPYLSVLGTAEEAFNFYRKVFNCPAPVSVMRFKEAPPDAIQLPPGMEEKVMHIAMPFGEGMLMGSDTWNTPEESFKPGNASHVLVDADSEEEARRIFGELSTDGEIGMPLEQQFWGSLFGIVVDRFGTRWMIHHGSQE